MIFSK